MSMGYKGKVVSILNERPKNYGGETLYFFVFMGYNHTGYLYLHLTV